jgi:hypothetical protein
MGIARSRAGSVFFSIYRRREKVPVKNEFERGGERDDAS